MNTPNNFSESEKSDRDSDFSELVDISRLSSGQCQFFQLLYNTPELSRLKDLWTPQPSPSMDLELADKAMRVLSGGEAHLLAFLANVWLREDRYNFNLIDAVSELDEPELKIIRSWIDSPFYP